MWTECGPDRPHDETIMGEFGLRPVIAEEGGAAASGDQDPFSSTTVPHFQRHSSI